MFNNIAIPTDISKGGDKLFTGSSILESGLYKAKVTQAYATQSKGGASGLVVKFTIIQSDGSESFFNHTFWVTNKQGQVTYQDKKGNQHFLQGYVLADDLAIATAGKGITKLKAAKRTFEIYNFETKQPEPTEVDAYPEIMGKEVALGILKIRENKQVYSDGVYVATADEVFKNDIEKVFVIKDGEIYTTTELEVGSTATFVEKWVESRKDYLRDRYKQVSGSGSASSSGSATTPLDIV